ncbi:MAG: STAS domain-containing protein [Candidatus Eremiobacteraeota bacterium]|nr:STAS domain-containing protein [Candidatus Eremiobacteraeota bacterium]MBV8354911.1 STAS domain-containing protein [Candidatus Eremiobacteraeota bacterium]
MKQQQPAFRVERLNDVAVVHVSGDVDLHDARQLDEAMHEAITGGPCETLLISFIETRYVDTTCLGLLVKVSREQGQKLRLVVPAESPMRRLLTTTGLIRALTVHDDFSGAFAAAAARNAVL